MICVAWMMKMLRMMYILITIIQNVLRHRFETLFRSELFEKLMYIVQQ